MRIVGTRQNKVVLNLDVVHDEFVGNDRNVTSHLVEIEVDLNGIMTQVVKSLKNTSGKSRDGALTVKVVS